jgi:hypothetical protein
MRNHQVLTAGSAALVAVVAGVAITGCSPSGSAGPQPAATTSAAAASSSAANPPADQPVKASDGSFTVNLPAGMKVIPDAGPLILAMGEPGNPTFTASVSPSDRRGNTCEESILKIQPAVAKKLHATFDPGVQTATVDGELARQSAMTLQVIPKARTEEWRGSLLCVRHHDVEYSVMFADLPASAPAEWDAILGSWKWAA